MFALAIPGFGDLALDHLVLDFNGTLACDGRLIPGVATRLEALSATLTLRVVTADTFGTVRAVLADAPCEVEILAPGDEAQAKEAVVRTLGAGRTAFIGNGRNDALALAEAALGITVIQAECSSTAALTAADVVAPDILMALELFRHPDRLRATLRH